VCDNFPRQFHFFLGAIHEKHKFTYFKNLTVKVCKIWCNDVYMSILQCDIFWWKLIDRNFFNTKVVLRTSPLFCSFHCFARDYLQTGYSDMLEIVMSKYIICQSFKKFHRAVFSIAHPKYRNFGGILEARW
jgi:hypothetical protein